MVALIGSILEKKPQNYVFVSLPEVDVKNFFGGNLENLEVKQQEWAILKAINIFGV